MLDLTVNLCYNKIIDKSEVVCMEYITMVMKKAEIEDLNIVVVSQTNI